MTTEDQFKKCWKCIHLRNLSSDIAFCRWYAGMELGCEGEQV